MEISYASHTRPGRQPRCRHASDAPTHPLAHAPLSTPHTHTQEPHLHQVEYLAEALPDYGWVGDGRNPVIFGLGEEVSTQPPAGRRGGGGLWVGGGGGGGGGCTQSNLLPHQQKLTQSASPFVPCKRHAHSRSQFTHTCTCDACTAHSPAARCLPLPQHCEYNPIFYDKTQVELVSNGQFWLSDMPEVRQTVLCFWGRRGGRGGV